VDAFDTHISLGEGQGVPRALRHFWDVLKGPPDGWHGRVARTPHVTVVYSEQPQEQIVF